MDRIKFDDGDPRQVLIQAIESSQSPEQFYERILEEIVDSEGCINFYFFDIGMALVKAFYDKSRIPEEDAEKLIDKKRQGGTYGEHIN